MEKTKLDEIIQLGISGIRETLPEERILFLSTLRERTYIALTNKQVIKKGMYPEVIKLFQSQKQDMHLFLNGDLSYNQYSNYVKEAIKHKIPFTIINDKSKTPFGLVVASKAAIVYKDDVFIKDDVFNSMVGAK